MIFAAAKMLPGKGPIRGSNQREVASQSDLLPDPPCILIAHDNVLWVLQQRAGNMLVITS